MMLPINHVWVSVGTSRWICCVSTFKQVFFEMHLKMGLTRTLQMWWCMILPAWIFATSNTLHTLPTCLFTLGRSRLPRRKLWKIRIMLNLCPSHTEIFSKRRKIYSWLCERLELMWLPLKNDPASRVLGNAFDLDFEFHWANDREIEARWGLTLVEDNCNNLALAKVAGIARMSYNPLVFQW